MSKYKNIIGEMERRNPGISRVMADSLSPAAEEDSLMAYVLPKGIPEGAIQAMRPNYTRPLSPAEENPEQESQGAKDFMSSAGRYPGSSERAAIEKTPSTRREDSGITYSNYRTGPGIKLPKGMAMMGEEPRQETEQEFLVKNGALDVVGHDPYKSAWERTVKDYEGWFDIMGGESTPENPKFREVYGKEFDADLQKHQAEELAKRNQGMEKITKLINQYRGSMDHEGNSIPDATEMDVLKTLGIKGLPGIKDPRDYQEGVPDAGMNSFKEQKKEEIRLQKESMREGKDQKRAKRKWITDNTSKLNRAYSELKTAVNEKIVSWNEKLKEANKHYDKGEEGWDTYRQSYIDSIARLEDFKEKFPDYLDADRTAIAQGQAPVNWQKVKQYWSNAIIKYK